jgi:hypothetical protein
MPNPRYLANAKASPAGRRLIEAASDIALIAAPLLLNPALCAIWYPSFMGYCPQPRYRRLCPGGSFAAALDLGLQIAAAPAHHAIFRGIGLRLRVRCGIVLALSEKSRVRIWKPPCRALDRETTRTSGFDPTLPWRLESDPGFFSELMRHTNSSRALMAMPSGTRGKIIEIPQILIVNSMSLAGP